MNNRRGILILLVVFIVLAGIVLLEPNLNDLTSRLDSVTSTPEETATSPFNYVFPDLTVTDIQAIRLQSPVTNETFTIARAADGTWTAPETPGTLDQEAASNILQTIVLLIYTYTTPVPENGDLEQFGFRPNGDFLIAILMRDGNVHAVAVGAALQTGPEFYACVDDFCTEGNPQVHILQRSPIDYLVNFLQAPPVSP